MTLNDPASPLILAPLPRVPSVDPTHGGGCVFPASYAQQRLWFLDRLAPGRALYNIAWAVRLVGPLDVDVLQRALDAVVARHESLRTRIDVVQGRPVQIVLPALHVELPVEDLRSLPESGREAAADARARAEAAAPFDLARGPLLRSRLLRLDDERHWLLLSIHHIVTDGWSMAVLGREISALYNARRRGAPAGLRGLPVQYADYAVWQRRRLEGATLARLLAFWEAEVAGLPSLELPLDRTRSPALDTRGGIVRFRLDATITGALRSLARREGATLFMVLLAAFDVLLHRVSGQSDFAVGVPTAGRQHADLGALIGFFVNTLVIRADMRGAPTFTAHLARVRRSFLAALEHQELPFEKLVEHVAPRRDLSRNPLFQVMFALQNAPWVNWSLDGLEVASPEHRNDALAKFDLSVMLRESDGGLAGEFLYAAALFDVGTIECITGQFERLLAAIARAPGERIDRLPMLGPEERERIVVDWNRTARPYPDTACVHHLVEAVAARTPSARAIVEGTEVTSYGDLDARANRLAQLLCRHSTRPAPRIGICLERGTEQVVAMLAILKAGGTYVPLDPELPPERLAFLQHDAGIGLVVTTSALEARLGASGNVRVSIDRDAGHIAAQPPAKPAAGCGALSPAYVMYTSGSTGTPKGVLVAHRAITRLVCNTDYARIDATDVVAHAASTAFDAATFEVWSALVHGACLVVVPRLTLLSPKTYAALLQASGVTTLFLTTALFNQMARTVPEAFGGCRTVLFGGEAVEPRWVKTVLDATPPQRLVHVYGPTETTTFATWHLVGKVGSDTPTIPIGRPIANTEAYVLDADGEVVPVGVPGELYIGGPGLAIGYLDRPELTAERFVRHPFSSDPQARLYRTGDRVRYRTDGAIVFLGRTDNQVKLRGHRIELEEVEATLKRLPQLRDAAVALRGDASDTRQLVAYLVAADTSGPPPANLWSELKTLLPAYMVPGAIVWLKSLPLTPNGKVDRQALPSASPVATPAAASRIAPRDMFEQVITGIFERVLGVAGLGVLDHFFEHGGHSLLAAQLMDEIERETGLAAPLRALFADDTVAGVARMLREGLTDQAAPAVLLNAEGTRPPLVFLHGDLSGGGFCCRPLARALGGDQPLLVIHPHTLDGPGVPETIEAMARDRIAVLRSALPRGPYCLGGFCNGALVAFEMARQLVAEGESVPVVVAVQSRAPREGHANTAAEDGRYVVYERDGSVRPLVPRDRASEMQLRYSQVIDRYAGGRFYGRLALIRGASLHDPARDLGWTRFARTVEIQNLPGDHVTLVTRHVAALAQAVRGALERALAPPKS